MTFELWHTRSSSMIGDFPIEHAALDAICEAIEVHGPAYVGTWGLAYEDRRGRTNVIARSAALVDRALGATKAAAGDAVCRPVPDARGR